MSPGDRYKRVLEILIAILREFAGRPQLPISESTPMSGIYDPELSADVADALGGGLALRNSQVNESFSGLSRGAYRKVGDLAGALLDAVNQNLGTA